MNDIDTRNKESTNCILQVNMLPRISVRAYEPQLLSTPVEVIRGGDIPIAGPEIQSQRGADVPISRVRMLGSTTFICLALTSRRLSQHVPLDYVRYSVDLYVDSTVQCCSCGSYGHVTVTCGSTPWRSKYSGPHEFAACPADL